MFSSFIERLVSILGTSLRLLLPFSHLQRILLQNLEIDFLDFWRLEEFKEVLDGGWSKVVSKKSQIIKIDQESVHIDS